MVLIGDSSHLSRKIQANREGMKDDTSSKLAAKRKSVEPPIRCNRLQDQERNKRRTLYNDKGDNPSSRQNS